METYFNIRYEMDKEAVWQSIDRFIREQAPTYICVADGVILNITNRNPEYLKVVNGSAFSICDSSYVPIYLKWIYGIHREQYCGSQIFMDLIKMKKYRMFFMGTSAKTLAALKENLVKIDNRIADMTFYELPFRTVDQFDYQKIADMGCTGCAQARDFHEQVEAFPETRRNDCCWGCFQVLQRP